MESYKVLSPIKHGGKRIEDGAVELDKKTAGPLLADGLIAKTTPQRPAAPEGAEKLVKIKAAIASLDKDNAKLFTKGGVPTTQAIEAVTGWAVSADERNAAVETPKASETPKADEGIDRDAHIKAAIASLDKDNAKLFTKGGVPTTQAIEAVTGWAVSADERDAAVEIPAPAAE